MIFKTMISKKLSTTSIALLCCVTLSPQAVLSMDEMKENELVSLNKSGPRIQVIFSNITESGKEIPENHLLKKGYLHADYLHKWRSWGGKRYSDKDAFLSHDIYFKKEMIISTKSVEFSNNDPNSENNAHRLEVRYGLSLKEEDKSLKSSSFLHSLSLKECIGKELIVFEISVDFCSSWEQYTDIPSKYEVSTYKFPSTSK